MENLAPYIERVLRQHPIVSVIVDRETGQVHINGNNVTAPTLSPDECWQQSVAIYLTTQPPHVEHVCVSVSDTPTHSLTYLMGRDGTPLHVDENTVYETQEKISNEIDTPLELGDSIFSDETPIVTFDAKTPTARNRKMPAVSRRNFFIAIGVATTLGAGTAFIVNRKPSPATPVATSGVSPSPSPVAASSRGVSLGDSSVKTVALPTKTPPPGFAAIVPWAVPIAKNFSPVATARFVGVIGVGGLSVSVFSIDGVFSWSVALPVACDGLSVFEDGGAPVVCAWSLGKKVFVVGDGKIVDSVDVGGDGRVFRGDGAVMVSTSDRRLVVASRQGFRDVELLNGFVPMGSFGGIVVGGNISGLVVAGVPGSTMKPVALKPFESGATVVNLFAVSGDRVVAVWGLGSKFMVAVHDVVSGNVLGGVVASGVSARSPVVVSPDGDVVGVGSVLVRGVGSLKPAVVDFAGVEWVTPGLSVSYGKKGSSWVEFVSEVKSIGDVRAAIPWCVVSPHVIVVDVDGDAWFAYVLSPVAAATSAAAV